MRSYLGALAIAATLAVPAAVNADGHFEKAIKARQAVYQVYLFNISQLGAMAKGEMDFDAELAQNSANNLLAAANMKNGAMWPAGSHKAAVPGKTRALEDIWTTWPAIMEKQTAFVAAATAMAANAGTLDGVRANIGDLGGSCKACHDDYRAKDF